MIDKGDAMSEEPAHPARDHGDDTEPPSWTWDEARGGPVAPEYEGDLGG